MSAVRAEGLYKVFGRRPDEAVHRLREGVPREEIVKSGATPAVIDASFEVVPGEIFVVMGLSGSGKSTLIRMLNGLWEPSAGHVYVAGQDVAALDPGALRVLRRDQMSMVFQHFALFPHRTVAENAAYALSVRGVDRVAQREKAYEALSLVGLEGWEEAMPGQLSGGMKQRVGLARALAAETEVLLMDEAFSALDPLIRREMQDQLLKLQATLDKTIVFITHDLNEAMRLGDRVAIMRAGQIVQIGTAEEILEQPANEYVAQFVQDVDRTRVLTAANVMVRPRTVVVEGQGPRAALRAMQNDQASAAFVVSREGRLLGVIRDDAAMDVLNAKGTTLEGALDREPATVNEDTPLAEVFAPSAESPVPVAVIGDGGKLSGVIPRVTLLTAMATVAGTDSPEVGVEPLDTPDREQEVSSHG